MDKITVKKTKNGWTWKRTGPRGKKVDGGKERGRDAALELAVRSAHTNPPAELEVDDG